jgi:PAS domain S-box-containing protein
MTDKSLDQHAALADQVGLLALLEDGLDALKLGTGLFDASLRLVDCNRLFRKLRGYPASLCQPGTPLVELLKHDLRCGQLDDGGRKDAVHHWMEMAVKRRRHTVETKLDDGRVAAMTLMPIGDQGVILTVSDISHHTRATESLRAKQEWLDLVTEASSEGIYDWDVSSGNLKVSYRLTAMLGLLPGDLKASEWNKCIHPDDFAGYRAAITNYFKGESPYLKCEYRVRRHSGDYIWFADSGKCVRDGSGRAYRLVGAVSDITARKIAEAALAQSEERHALAMQAATEGLYDWNVIADQLVVSERLNAIMQMQSGTLSANEWNERVHPGDRDKYRAAMRAHFRGKTRYLSCEYRARTGAGEYIWLSDNATSVRNADGRVVRLVGAIANINARKQADDELREAKKRAENASLLAMEKARMLESLSTKLSKYLSPQVYSSIFTGRQNVAIEAKRKKLTIFFSDIVGFTSIADVLESEDLTALLNDYLTEMSRIALDHGATIDKFIGDAILAFFGDPESKGPKDDAIACVSMAIAMQRRMREMQADWRQRGMDRTFELRIGITTGFCTVGNFGSEDRMDYTVVGNEVNRAARLQVHAETGGILLSGETYALVKDVIAASEEGQIALKGIPRPVLAYKVLGIYNDLVSDGRIIALDQPGMRLLVNPDELTPESRTVALQALEQAVARLRQQQK